MAELSDSENGRGGGGAAVAAAAEAAVALAALLNRQGQGGAAVAVAVLVCRGLVAAAGPAREALVAQAERERERCDSAAGLILRPLQQAAGEDAAAPPAKARTPSAAGSAALGVYEWELAASRKRMRSEPLSSRPRILPALSEKDVNALLAAAAAEPALAALGGLELLTAPASVRRPMHISLICHHRPLQALYLPPSLLWTQGTIDGGQQQLRVTLCCNSPWTAYLALSPRPGGSVAIERVTFFSEAETGAPAGLVGGGGEGTALSAWGVSRCVAMQRLSARALAVLSSPGFFDQHEGGLESWRKVLRFLVGHRRMFAQPCAGCRRILAPAGDGGVGHLLPPLLRPLSTSCPDDAYHASCLPTAKGLLYLT